MKKYYIININEFGCFLEIIKTSNIIYIYFENKLHNNINIYNYLQIMIFYIDKNIYILNIFSIFKEDKHYGIVLLKRLLDIINKDERIKIMFNINQMDLLSNFIIKYDIKNINKKKRRKYIYLNIIPPNYIKNIIKIDDYYLNIMYLLYNTYNNIEDINL